MRKTVWPIVALALFSTACDSAEDKACDDAIKATLKAPSSYKRISKVGGKIEYDAVNSFNAPLRGRGVCLYDAEKGTALWLESSPN